MSDTDIPIDIQKPCPSDVTKLHAEMNQYINQRLIITTTAITLFGVSIGWIVFGSSTATGLEIRPVTFLLPTILLLVLLVLLVYCQVILGNMRIIAGYLRQTQSSPWESAYQELAREKRFITQDDVFPMMFAVLGFSVGLIVFLLWFSFPEEKASSYNIGVSSTLFMMTWIAYLLIVSFSWCRVIFSFGFKDNADKEWEILFANREESSSGETLKAEATAALSSKEVAITLAEEISNSQSFLSPPELLGTGLREKEGILVFETEALDHVDFGFLISQSREEASWG